jgi:ABC-2 type transport system ATP-binding protein
LSSRVLKLTGITKRYGSLTALSGVDLHIAPGQFFGLLGPNGAGKSTLMSIISGYLQPDEGRIELDGRPVDPRDNAWRARIGLVPQQVALWEDLSAQANLEIFGSLLGVRGAQLRKRVDALLEAVRLADRRRDAVREFSGGMKRRLNIAAALLHEPLLLLCDEPTVGVDPQSRNAIFEHLQTLHRGGLTVIYTTHYMEEASRLCERVAIIDGGRIAALGTEDELLGRLPFSEEVRISRLGCSQAQLDTLCAHGALAGDEDAWTVRVRDGVPLSQVIAGLETAGVDTRHVSVTRPDLEAVFLHLTGKSLRD